MTEEEKKSNTAKLAIAGSVLLVVLMAIGVVIYLLVPWPNSDNDRSNGGAIDLPPATSNDTLEVLKLAKSGIEDLIDQDRNLAAKFVRLGFHDCVGGCDGCVDMQNADNAGLAYPIEALHPILEAYENENVTRADIWALAAMTAAEVSQPNDGQQIDFPMNTVGRTNCESLGSPCLDEDENTVECNETRGPHRGLPSNDVTTHELLGFFEETFGFDARQTVAIMGAHTLGGASRQNSGFIGSQGWVECEGVLDVDYYDEIVGGNATSDLEELMDASNWVQVEIDNSDLAHVPNRFQWIHGSSDEEQGDSNGGDNLFDRRQLRGDSRRLTDSNDGCGGTTIFMINADLSLVRDFTGLIDERGEVSCTFESPQQSRCPHAAETIRIAAEFRSDNSLWVREFRDVMTLMVNQGLSS